MGIGCSWGSTVHTFWRRTRNQCYLSPIKWVRSLRRPAQAWKPSSSIYMGVGLLASRHSYIKCMFGSGLTRSEYQSSQSTTAKLRSILTQMDWTTAIRHICGFFTTSNKSSVTFFVIYRRDTKEDHPHWWFCRRKFSRCPHLPSYQTGVESAWRNSTDLSCAEPQL